MAESSLDGHSIHKISGLQSASFAIIILLIVSIPADVFGQDKNSGKEIRVQGQQNVEQILKRLSQQKEQESIPTLSPRKARINPNSLSGTYTFFEHDQSWNRNPNPNPQLNFALFGQGKPAGNINGDNIDGSSIDDFIVTGLARDERTSALEDSVYKTAVFYGGNTSGDPDQIIYRKLEPVGDLNGDGYADAVAVDSTYGHNTIDIYEGTDSGYSKTTSTLNDLKSANSNILGFQDFNGDGRDDIFLYSETTGEVKIAEGQINFGDMLVDTYSILSSLSKKVVVEDIDQDNRIEVVEFRGANSDGQIEVFEFNSVESSFVQDVSSFAFTPAFEDASETDLHLIDINGDGYDEIYISLGKKSPKYFFEYDTGTDSYTASKEIADQSLVPAGDLDNDGNHDFIIGDPNNLYTPYIAYGPDNISSDPLDLTLDVPLEGESTLDWTWEMEYNPYSRFGDFNGDGIDDALLSHSEGTGQNETVGRRILKGTTGQFDNSIFHQYPHENFYSKILAVEELRDINGDDVDDFAMTFNSQKKIEIYHGGNTISQTPNLTITPNIHIHNIASGDYTGDGVNDLLIKGSNGTNDVVVLYRLGSSATKIKSWTSPDIQGNLDINDLQDVHTIGDINGNGSDDFLVGSGGAKDSDGYLNQVYIFYGGSTISSVPDSTIQMGGSTDNIWAGLSATSIGDVDGDEVDDFAVSAPFKSVENGSGEVQVFLSSETEPQILSPDGTHIWFGFSLVSGDFNGDGTNDIAANTVTSYSSPPALIQVFHGEFDGNGAFETSADRLLSVPKFESESEEYFDTSFGILEAIPDFNNDNKDELLLGSSYVYTNNHHAALYTFNDIDGDGSEISYLKKPNHGAGLGGNNFFSSGQIATGDFNNDNALDVVLTQYHDNNDAYSSSRTYRFELSSMLTITSVQDIPNDQGGKVRINVGGYLTENTSDYDSLSVQRQTEKGEWQTLITDAGAASYDVDVPDTQPTNNDEIDNSYTFRVLAYSDTLITQSQQATGRAIDNIAPPKVQSLSIDQQDGSKMLNWQAAGISDLDNYLVFNVNDNGSIPSEPVDSSSNTSFSLTNDFTGVQKFVVSARDTNNNIGPVSDPIRVSLSKTIDYDVKKGWNLIGLSVNANADSVASFLSETSNGAIYEYDGFYKQVDSLEGGKGYWAKFPADANYQLSGTPKEELTIDLRKGWNLINGVGTEVPFSSVNDPNDILISGTLTSFDQMYSSVDTMRTNSGYWVRTSAAGEITLTHPSLNESQSQEKAFKQNLAKEDNNIGEIFNNVTISDDQGHSTELYFGAKLPDQYNKLSFTVPPLPPGNVFDARLKNNTRLTEKNEMYIKLEKLENTTLTINVGVQSLSKFESFILKEFKDGKEVSKRTIKPEKEVRLTNEDADAIYLVPEGVSQFANKETPEKFKLNKNYPNPFNPTTKIEYAIAETSPVTLEIFNVLGRKVATLVDKQQQPGFYNVTFDGSNLASGMYLYRLEAGDYVSTKKFILVK